MNRRLDLDAALRAHLHASDNLDLPSVGLDAMLGQILARPQRAVRSARWLTVSRPSRATGYRLAIVFGLLLALLVGAALLAARQPVTPPPTRTYRGVFSPVGDMVEGRSGFATAPLADGRVLVLGGNMSDTSGKSAELFDPGTGAFTATSSMAYWRTEPTATLLDDGRVLVVGGFGPDLVVSSTAELYDPSTGTWSVTGPLSIPRLGHTATPLPDGRVLVAGGGGSDEVPTRSAELFDPRTGAFTPTGDMTVPRNGHTATLLHDGRVLFAGGEVAGDSTHEVTASAELFDPATVTFAATGPMVTAAADRSVAILHDGRVLVLEGWRPVPGDADYLADAELYDPVSGTFTRTQSTADDHLGATGSWAITLDDGSVLVIGTPSQRFDPASEVFVAISQPQLVPFGPTVLTHLADGRVLVTGGCAPRPAGTCGRAWVFE